MTTKIIEAEAQSLPVCAGCGRHPIRCPHDASKVGCQDVNTCWMFGWWLDAKWRLLMTPEAKGEMNFPKAIEFISQGFEEKERLRIENGGLVSDRAILQSRVDFLQSKLAKSEEHVRKLSAMDTVYQKELSSLKQQLAESEERIKDAEKVNAALRVHIQTGDKELVRVQREFDAHKEVAQKEITSLKQQLAEATKPVGDAELEGAHNHLDNFIQIKATNDHEYRASLMRSKAILIRAARQRKPSGDAGIQDVSPISRPDDAARVPSGPVFITDPVEIEKVSAKIKEAQKNPTVTFSGFSTSWPKLNGAVDAISKLLGDFAMIFKDGALRDREEHEPHADVNETGLRPAAPAPSAATPDPFAKWGKYAESWVMSKDHAGHVLIRDAHRSCRFNGGKWCEYGVIEMHRFGKEYPNEHLLTESEARAFLAQHPLPPEMQ